MRNEMGDKIAMWIKSAAAAIGGAAAYLWGPWDALITALIALVAIDYVTGVICAAVNGKLNSSVGFKGLMKKALIFALVAVAGIADRVIPAANQAIRAAVILFYTANEAISIMENAAELGLPVAAALVADHRDLSVPDAAPLTERELVYLADKYCHGREFVPLELRFGQKLDLYAADPAACAAIRGRLGRARAPADIARQALEALLKAKGGEPEAEPNSSRGDT